MDKGWYTDPDNPEEERWWTGSEWSSQTRSSRGRDLQEAGKRSSEQDLRPRRRRKSSSADTPSSAASSADISSDSDGDVPSADTPLSEAPDASPSPPSFQPGTKKEDNNQDSETREDAAPSFVELPAAKKDIGQEKNWEDQEQPARKAKRSRRSRRTEKATTNDFQSFEELEDPSDKGDVFASFGKEELSYDQSEEKPEVPPKTSSAKKSDSTSGKKDSQSSTPKAAKKKKSARKRSEPAHKKTRKRGKLKVAALVSGASQRVRNKLADREKGVEPSSLRIATKRFLPIAAGLILVIGGAAVIGPLLEGEDPPPKTLQDRLSNELAAKRKAIKKPYPGVERCIRSDGNVNSVLRERSDSGQWEWKVIYVAKNYQLITVTLHSSDAEARQSAELSASSFLTASGGPFSIQGPIKGLAGGETAELETISRYMSQLSDCLAKIA